MGPWRRRHRGGGGGEKRIKKLRAIKNARFFFFFDGYRRRRPDRVFLRDDVKVNRLWSVVCVLGMNSVRAQAFFLFLFFIVTFFRIQRVSDARFSSRRGPGNFFFLYI